MENIYLTGEELRWKQLIKYSIWVMLGGTFFILLEYFKVIQMDSSDMFSYLYLITSVLVIIQVISPKLNKCIVDEIKFRSESLDTIILPTIAAILTRIVVDTIQLLPVLFASNPIAIGSRQANMGGYNPIEKLLVGTLLAPCWEEFIFRVVFFSCIRYMLGYTDGKYNSDLSNKVIDLSSALCWMLIIINNIIFSLMHGPSIFSFWLYFVGGLVDTIIYIKYGFFSSWISHGLFNYLHFQHIILKFL